VPHSHSHSSCQFAAASSWHTMQPPTPPSQRHSVFTSNPTAVSASLCLSAVSASLHARIPSQTRTTHPSGTHRPSAQHREARVPLCRGWQCRRGAARRVGSRNSRRARGCVCVCVCVLSQSVHAPIVEVPNLPSPKCSSHWSLGKYPAYAASWVRRCYQTHYEMNLTSTQWPTPTYRGRKPMNNPISTVANAVRTCLSCTLNPSSNPDPNPIDRIVFHTRNDDVTDVEPV
jgi:hypothetical protein